MVVVVVVKGVFALLSGPEGATRLGVVQPHTLSSGSSGSHFFLVAQNLWGQELQSLWRW